MIRPGRYFFLVLLAVFPHFQLFPMDVLIVTGIFFAWTAAFCYKSLLRPSAWFLRGATLGAVAYCWVRYGSLANPDAATAVLCMITILKLFETQSYRDAMALLLISLIVVMAYLIQSYSLLASLYMVTVFIMVIYFMMELQRKRYFLRQNVVRWKDLFSLEMVVALPLLVGLFVFFPRFTTRIGSGERQVQSVGFSDQIELGQLISLAQSTEVAFKVRFLKQTDVHYDSLYFRGAVLTRNKDMSWRKSTVNAEYVPSRQNSADPEYQVFLPARNQKNLFTLEKGAVTQTTPHLYLFRKNAENVYFTSSAIDHSLSYMVASTNELPRTYTPEELSVRMEMTESLQNLIDRLGGGTDEDRINSILRYFRDGGFVYSTEVPGYKHIDEFLAAKVGFCEHYASSLVLLARLLKVPSRIVVGFMGGEINPFDGTLTVRDRFAHAWAEVYLEGKGWTRVDPTVAVYPQRAQNLFAATAGNQQFYESVFSNGLLLLESINTQFELAMMNFNSDSQLGIISRMSDFFQVKMVVILFAVPLFFILMITIAWWIWRMDFRNADPLANAYALLLKKLSRRGFTKKESEGSLEFERRLTEESAPKNYTDLLRQYTLLRYAHPPDTAKIRAFSQLVQKAR